MNKYALLGLALACGAVGEPASLLAQDQGTIPVRLLQNEIKDLPVDHSALIAASSTVSIALEMPSTDDLASMLDAVVTVIRPNGETTQVRPDASGLVSIDEVDEGPHALVASSDRAHGAKLFYFKKAEKAGVDAPGIAKMSMLSIVGDQLLPLMEEIDDVNGPRADLVPDLKLGPESGYRVVLGEGGTVKGDVLTLADRLGGSHLKGMRIVVFHRGVQVADTKCDELGQFEASGLNPGTHGLIAAGREGYAAFAFEAVDADAGVASQKERRQYVSTLTDPSDESTDPSDESTDPSDEPTVPKIKVPLIPPNLCPELVKAIEDAYKPDQTQEGSGQLGDVMIAGGYDFPGFNRGGGGGGGGGGVSGIGGLGAAVGIAAVVALADDDDEILLPPVASPVAP